MTNFIKCTSCVANIPVVKVQEWEGKCPRCRSVEQKEYRPARIKVQKGNVICKTKECKAQLPEVLADKLDGLCPKCTGAQQAARTRNNSQKFSSIEEYQANKEQPICISCNQSDDIEPGDTKCQPCLEEEYDRAIGAYDGSFDDHDDTSCRCGGAGACIQCNPRMFI